MAGHSARYRDAICHSTDDRGTPISAGEASVSSAMGMPRAPRRGDSRGRESMAARYAARRGAGTRSRHERRHIDGGNALCMCSSHIVDGPGTTIGRPAAAHADGSM